ncbi:response regulator [Pedobacter frigiditerrae]|uniref:Response regulator n=1 Tax=Pedobacter frigiditerrae TaxID=2530452 RepID=A0A4R0N4Q1_9SPHI|nr:response regulator [Pedobacter frigiditerrae]TCC94357.1 response regulator [Pedobacter frigiditerrae]
MKLNFKDYLTKKKKILIVEDEPMSVRLIQHLLKDYHFELVVAVDGFEAIEKFKKTSFSLVIMDLYMPIMDGFEASRRMKEISKDTPIIVISTTSIPEEDLKRDIGIDYFLAKPLNTVKFRDFIHMLLLA